MEILLLRHFKTKGNLEGRYVGATDENLLPQALPEPLGEAGAFSPQILYTSGMKRTIETGELIFPEVPRRDRTGFRELDFGAFEYCNYEMLNGNPDYQRYIDSGGRLAFPGGEELEHMKNRCTGTFLECMEELREEHVERSAFVVHGGTIMAVMEAFVPGERTYFDYQVSCGCGYRCNVGGTNQTVSLDTVQYVTCEVKIRNRG